MQQVKTEVEDLLVRLELAAEQDAASVAESKPAVRKLSMLGDIQYVRLKLMQTAQQLFLLDC